jgi:hypothetical protein
VPSAEFVCVSDALPGFWILLIPKSSIFTKSSSPSLFTAKQFDGFMSRWMIPIACAAFRAEHRAGAQIDDGLIDHLQRGAREHVSDSRFHHIEGTHRAQVCERTCHGHAVEEENGSDIREFSPRVDLGSRHATR